MSVNEKEFAQKLKNYSRDTIRMIADFHDKRLLKALHIVNEAKTEEEAVRRILKLKGETK